MKSAIYTITNLVNNKMYVGYAINYNKRWWDHRKNLKKGCHENEYLQRSWNKYGKDKFIFEVLVTCPINLLKSEEHYWATLLNVHNRNFGYNIAPTSPDGQVRKSPETINKIAQKNRGRKYSKEFGIKISIANTGKKRTIEVKRQLSKINRERNHRPNVVLDKQGTFLGKFNTLIEASEFMKYPNDVVAAAFRKRGFYKEYIILSEQIYNSGNYDIRKLKRKGIIMYDAITKQLLDQAETIKSLCQKYNLDASSVVATLNGRKKYYKQYIFERN